jgi:methylmalonyl-CoA/ethylmalonyl-CoA epimerase
MPDGPVGFPLVRGASLDHVAVAVRDAGRAATVYRDVLGGEFLYGADQPEQGFRFVQYRFPGGGKVELITPLGGGFVARFLDARGEGMHHITLRVSDLEAHVERLRQHGIEVILVDLRDANWKEAFIHPRDAHGVLIQLAETPHDDDETARHFGGAFPEAALLAPVPG